MSNRQIRLKKKGLFKKDYEVTFEALVDLFLSGKLKGYKDLAYENTTNKWLLLNCYGPFKIIVEKSIISSIITAFINGFISHTRALEVVDGEDCKDAARIPDNILDSELKYLYLYSIIYAVNQSVTEKYFIKLLLNAFFLNVYSDEQLSLSSHFINRIDERMEGYEKAMSDVHDFCQFERLGYKFLDYCGVEKNILLAISVNIKFSSIVQCITEPLKKVCVGWKKIIEL